MDTLTKEVAVPLGMYMKSFPAVQRLHPFEQAMLELTWGTQTYEKVLGKVDSLRKSILQASFLSSWGLGASGCDKTCCERGVSPISVLQYIQETCTSACIVYYWYMSR